MPIATKRPVKAARRRSTRPTATPAPPLQDRLAAALLLLHKHASPAYAAEIKTRYGITGATADPSVGVSMAVQKKLARQLGRDHELSLALWETGQYDARMLACLTGDPALVTPAQMNHWRRGFDNWATCDTACFSLFDRSPHAYARVPAWATAKGEFQKRAAFALIASLALHDKKADDDRFLPFLPIIQAAADDPRNFVKKGVSWALRGLARRPGLRKPALALARRLAHSESPAARWIGNAIPSASPTVTRV